MGKRVVVQKYRNELWWLKPAAPLAAVTILCISAYLLPASAYIKTYDTTKQIGTEYILLVAGTVLTICIGVYFGTTGKKRSLELRGARLLNPVRLVPAFNLVCGITLLAYLIWYTNFIRLNGPSSLLSVFSAEAVSGNMYIFRDASGSISGITTFTEFGVVASILTGIIQNSDYVDMRQKTRCKILFVLIIALACLRASLFSERLAIIELIVPYAIAWLGTSQRKTNSIEKVLPLVAIGALIVLFGFFEYARSWLTHYVYIYDSFWEYISTRLLGYYANAFNTEASYIQYGSISGIVPYWSIQWLWELPGMNTVYGALAPYNAIAGFRKLLSGIVNPEYNNPGGVLTFYKDFSYLGFIAVFILGYIAGRILASFRSGETLGLICYPVIFLTLLELPRYYYLGINRGFVVLIGIILAVYIVERNGVTRPLLVR